MGDDEMRCPQCAETVKTAAQVCRHCGYAFRGGRRWQRHQDLKALLFGVALFLGLCLYVWQAL